MARYWVGGTGSWDQSTTTHWSTSSGGSSGAAVPTATDDVIFDTNSGIGNVTLTANAPCQSIQSSSSTITTFTHNASVTLTIGSGTAGASNIALDFSGFTTYSLGSTTTSAVTFVSTSATVQTINFAGLPTGNVTYNASSGGSWQYIGSHNTGSGTTVTLTQGSLNFNGQTCTMGFFMSQNANVRSINLSNTSLTLTAGGAYASILDGNNLALSTTSCTVTLSGSSASFGPGYVTWASNSTIVFTGGGANTLSDSTALGSVTYTGTAQKTNQLLIGASRTIAGNLTVAGNSATNRVLLTSYQVGTTNVLTTNGTNSFSNVDFMDISGAGTGNWSLASITGGSGDCGGNSNITFTVAAQQTWQTTSGGNWSNSANWTSRVPLPQDNVVINAAFTASQTITADMPRLGASVNWTGTTGSPTWALTTTGNTIYGSITLISGMTLSQTQGATLAGRGSYTLTSAGLHYGSSLAFTAPSGTYTLQDDLYANGNFYVNNGAFNANNHNVTITSLQSSNTNSRTITLGNGIWSLQGTAAGTLVNLGTTTNLTLSAASATMVVANASSSSRTFVTAGSLTFGTLNYIVSGSSGSLAISGSNTFKTINFCDATNARTLQLAHSTTTTITHAFNVQGWPGNLITINSDSVGMPATLSMTSGAVVCDYLSIQDSTVAGGASWYAGSHSTNVSDNSGWSFTVGTLGGSLTATPVWSGLGLNYKADICFWNQDILYFKSIGLNNIRVHMPGSPQPWNSASNAFWRYCAQYFHAQGFWVTWGTSQTPVTNSNWTALHNSIVAEAQYLQQQNIIFDEYELGNEYEGAIAQKASSLTQISGTATYTASSNHGFTTGESVTVYGATPSGYNGTFTVTVTGSTTFTYSVSSSLSTPATGTIYAYSLSISQLNANIRQLATDVKAAYSLGKVSYACWNNDVNGTYEYSDWIANGLGSLDTISIHPYSNINTSTQSITFGGYTYVQEMVQAFGDKCYVSECGLDASSANIFAFNTGSSVTAMETIYNNYLLYYLEPVNSKAIFYMWSGYLNEDNQFAMQQTNGSLVPTWGVLLTNGNPINRGVNPARTGAPSHVATSQAKGSVFFSGSNTDTEVTPSNGSILQIGSSNNLTVGARVKLAVKTLSPNNDNHTIANCDLNYGSNLGYEFQVVSNTGALNAYSGSTAYTSPAGLVQYGTWQSVVFRINGTTLDAFVEGQKVWTTTITRKATGNASQRFGAENTGTGSTKRRIYGDAREFFAVQSPLSDQQIQAIALNASYPAVGVLYMLDEGGGSTAHDSSGSNNNGTISNPSWSADAGSIIRTNYITDPSIELASGSGWWSDGSAGPLTGLSYKFQDTTNVLYGTYAAQLQRNTVGQYYLDASGFTPTIGTIYTFSAYVYVPAGSLITQIGIGIRDTSTYNYIQNYYTQSYSEPYFAVTPGQWTRLSYSAIGGAPWSGGSSSSWRFTVADPLDSNNSTSSFTTPQSFWVDGTMLEASATVGTYFDGSTNSGTWTGTANRSTSELAVGRNTTVARTLIE